MNTIKKRPLDEELCDRFAYIPPFRSEPSEGKFDDYMGYIPPPGKVMFEEDEANRIEALKVKVWRDGGPVKVNEHTRENYGGEARVVETCDVGGCKQYLKGKLRSCYKCKRFLCEEHRTILLGAYVCPQCE